jgi:hypothetical protein
VSPVIRPLALALVRRGDELLVFEGLDSTEGDGPLYPGGLLELIA